MCISFEFPVKTTAIKEQMIATDHHAADCTLLQNLKDDKNELCVPLRMTWWYIVTDSVTETFGTLTSKTIKGIRIRFRDSLCHYAMAFFFFFKKSSES